MWWNSVLLIAVITMTISQSNGYHEDNQMTLGKHHRKGTAETGRVSQGRETFKDRFTIRRRIRESKS